MAGVPHQDFVDELFEELLTELDYRGSVEDYLEVLIEGLPSDETRPTLEDARIELLSSLVDRAQVTLTELRQDRSRMSTMVEAVEPA